MATVSLDIDAWRPGRLQRNQYSSITANVEVTNNTSEAHTGPIIGYRCPEWKAIPDIDLTPDSNNLGSLQASVAMLQYEISVMVTIQCLSYSVKKIAVNDENVLTELFLYEVYLLGETESRVKARMICLRCVYIICLGTYYREDVTVHHYGTKVMFWFVSFRWRAEKHYWMLYTSYIMRHEVLLWPSACRSFMKWFHSGLL